MAAPNTSAKHGTLLAMVSRHGLYIECAECRHANTIEVSELISRLGHAARVRDALERIKCSECGSRRTPEAWIISPKEYAPKVPSRATAEPTDIE